MRYERLSQSQMCFHIFTIKLNARIKAARVIKKKNRSYFVFRDRGRGGGRPKLNYLENPENERLFNVSMEKIAHILMVLRQRVGERAAVLQLSRKVKI